MNLLQTIRAIEKTAALQPGVQSIVRNDVFRLNASPVAKYGVFAWLQNEHSTTEDSSFITYNFTFFWSSKNKAWYWNGDTKKSRKRSKYTMDEKRIMHGSVVYENTEKKKRLSA